MYWTLGDWQLFARRECEELQKRVEERRAQDQCTTTLLGKPNDPEAFRVEQMLQWHAQTVLEVEAMRLQGKATRDGTATASSATVSSAAAAAAAAAAKGGLQAPFVFMHFIPGFVPNIAYEQRAILTHMTHMHQQLQRTMQLEQERALTFRVNYPGQFRNARGAVE